jgi:hypothetical protein
MDFDVENEKAAQKDHIFTANVMTQRKDKDKSFKRMLETAVVD